MVNAAQTATKHPRLGLTPMAGREALCDACNMQHASRQENYCCSSNHSMYSATLSANGEVSSQCRHDALLSERRSAKE